MIRDRLCAALRQHLARPGRPVIPAGGELFWRWFVDLSAARGWGMTGPNPITFEAIDAYSRLTGWPIEPRHVGTLRALDEVFVDHFRQQARENTTGAGHVSRISDRPVTAPLFDAMFGG